MAGLDDIGPKGDWRMQPAMKDLLDGQGVAAIRAALEKRSACNRPLVEA